MEQWDISVWVKQQRVCCISTGLFALQPAQLWTLLACQESASVFRVVGRDQLSKSNGTLVERVTFVAPVRIVFWKKWARTKVHQHVDMSDPAKVSVRFKLMHSDMMSHLTGSWSFEQVQPPSAGCPGRTRVTYCFEMWPKGVPKALKFMPGLLDAVKAAVAREASQLLDKLAFVTSKVRPGMSLEEAALLAASEVEAAGGSFKCLRLQQSGNLPEAAAAAAAEAAGKQALKHRKQQHQPKIVCHALDDLSSEGDDDTGLQPLDSCGSNMSSMSALTAQTSSSSLGNEWEASTQGRVSSSSSSAGSVMMMSLPSVDGLLTTMYRSFSSWRQTPTAPAV